MLFPHSGREAWHQLFNKNWVCLFRSVVFVKLWHADTYFRIFWFSFWTKITHYKSRITIHVFLASCDQLLLRMTLQFALTISTAYETACKHSQIYCFIIGKKMKKIKHNFTLSNLSVICRKSCFLFLVCCKCFSTCHRLFSLPFNSFLHICASL